MNHELEPILRNVFEGDRYTALQALRAYLKYHPTDTEALWYLAYATDDVEERYSILCHVRDAGHPPDLARLAQHFVAKEDALFLPPSTWEKRWQRIKRNKWRIGWTIIAILLFFFIALAFWQNWQYRVEQQIAAVEATTIAQYTPTPSPTATATALPAGGQYRINYPAGVLTILRLETNTNRELQTGSYNSEPATPMPGTAFAALQFSFTCQQGNCRTAPEATVSLLLSSGEEATLDQQSPLVVNGTYQTSCGRGAQCTGWLVFEVPIHDRVTAVRIRPNEADYDDPPLDISINR